MSKAKIEKQDSKSGAEFDLRKIISQDNPDLVKSIIESSDIDLNDYRDKFGNTILITACEKNMPRIAGLVLQKGADPNLFNKNGWTALMFAALKGNAENISLLLKHNAKIDQVTAKAVLTPLMIAAMNFKSEALICLIKSGANLYQKMESENIYNEKTVLQIIEDPLFKKFKGSEQIIKILQYALNIAENIKELINDKNLTAEKLESSLRFTAFDSKDQSQLSFNIDPFRITLDEDGRNMVHHLAEKRMFHLIKYFAGKSALPLDIADNNSVTAAMMIRLVSRSNKVIRKIIDQKAGDVIENISDFLDFKDLSSLALVTSEAKSIILKSQDEKKQDAEEPKEKSEHLALPKSSIQNPVISPLKPSPAPQIAQSD